VSTSESKTDCGFASINWQILIQIGFLKLRV